MPDPIDIDRGQHFDASPVYQWEKFPPPPLAWYLGVGIVLATAFTISLVEVLVAPKAKFIPIGGAWVSLVCIVLGAGFLFFALERRRSFIARCRSQALDVIAEHVATRKQENLGAEGRARQKDRSEAEKGVRETLEAAEEILRRAGANADAEIVAAERRRARIPGRRPGENGFQRYAEKAQLRQEEKLKRRSTESNRDVSRKWRRWAGWLPKQIKRLGLRLELRLKLDIALTVSLFVSLVAAGTAGAQATGSVIKHGGDTSTNRTFNAPFVKVTLPTPFSTGSSSIGPFIGILGGEHPTTPSDCLAFYVELDEVGEENLALAKRVVHNLPHPQGGYCGLNGQRQELRFIKTH